MHVMLPLPNVAPAIWENHRSKSVFFIIFVFSFIDFTVVPCVLPPAMIVPVLERSCVAASAWPTVGSMPGAIIVLPESAVALSVRGCLDTEAVLLAI